MYHQQDVNIQCSKSLPRGRGCVSCDATVNRSKLYLLKINKTYFGHGYKLTVSLGTLLVRRIGWWLGICGMWEPFTAQVEEKSSHFFEETRNIFDLSSTIDILKWIRKNCFE